MQGIPTHPLAEVFGYPITNNSPQAQNARSRRLCPYNNRVAQCTKVSVESPLGVCSCYERGHAVIVCPVRFRQDWRIADDAARFFFPKGSHCAFLTEVRLNDAYGESAGNIDAVLVSLDTRGRIIDFGALEIQSVYISGNIRDPFEAYMSNPDNGARFSWAGHAKYPRPDYLSSSRKRLAPQLLFKGGILNFWGKKLAVALDDDFFATLPALPQVEPSEAEIAWLVYTLQFDSLAHRFVLSKVKTVYTSFEACLSTLTVPTPGSVNDFEAQLIAKLDGRRIGSSGPTISL